MRSHRDHRNQFDMPTKVEIKAQLDEASALVEPLKSELGGGEEWSRGEARPDGRTTQDELGTGRRATGDS